MSRLTMLSYNAAKSCCRIQQLQIFQAFHSSARNGSSPKPRRNKSRKLPSLQPTPFVREELPHSGLQERQEKVKVTGFRRRSGAENKRDWLRRTGRWGDELKDSNSRTGPGSSLMRQVRDKVPDGARYSNRSAAALSQKSEKYKKYDSSQNEVPNSFAEVLPANERTSSKYQLPPIKAFLKPPDLINHRRPPIDSEHDSTAQPSIYTNFTSPPLLPGLRSCLLDILGHHATPTRIQSLSMKHILPSSDQSSELLSVSETRSKQWLLASETGSGKSIAYLLPLLQSLKLSELDSSLTSRTLAKGEKELNPRALVLAPTHELARQLSMFAKALQHEIKLRIMCASRANTVSSGQGRRRPGSHTRERGIRASEMSTLDISESETGEFDLTRESRPVDVLVGTPMKLLEMVRGRGWEKGEDGPGSVMVPDEAEDEKRKLRRGRDRIPGASNKAGSEGVMGLKHVEWVIVDEADVLFDPDFQETTRMLLSDISAAKGLSSSEPLPDNTTTYPFNLIFTSATIPTSLHNYITQNHPDMQHLISPGVHKLPKDLKVEYVNWTGGNRMADVEKRIRQVWAEDHLSIPKGDLSQVIIFCNKSNKVRSLGEYLESKKIKNVSVTSTSEARAKGSNRHLRGFLRTLPEKGPENKESDKKEVIWDNEEVATSTSSDPVLSGPRVLTPTTTSVTSSTPLSPSVEEDPLVLITTSLLSRGLDFSPSIKHVFIIDEPRNVLDFLHRAGRSGRAGHKGRVVVFGKFPDSGRGAGRGREVKKRVGDLVSRRRS